jgi:hypothetical protein
MVPALFSVQRMGAYEIDSRLGLPRCICNSDRVAIVRLTYLLLCFNIAMVGTAYPQGFLYHYLRID